MENSAFLHSVQIKSFDAQSFHYAHKRLPSDVEKAVPKSVFFRAQLFWEPKPEASSEANVSKSCRMSSIVYRLRRVPHVYPPNA